MHEILYMQLLPGGGQWHMYVVYERAPRTVGGHGGEGQGQAQYAHVMDCGVCQHTQKIARSTCSCAQPQRCPSPSHCIPAVLSLAPK